MNPGLSFKTGASQGCERCRFYKSTNGKYRVRIVRPPELRPYLPPPHTGKANLTRAVGTGNEPEANRLAFPWIADFQAAIQRRFDHRKSHGYCRATDTGALATKERDRLTERRVG